MVWGYLQLTGRIEEPLVAGLRRLVLLAVVLGGSLHLWLYNTVIVDTFYQAPAELAARGRRRSAIRSPPSTPSGAQGGAVAGYLWNNGGVFNGDFGYYVAGAIVWVLMGLLCVYTMFLIALSSIALAVLLALGPLFIALHALRCDPQVLRGLAGPARQLCAHHPPHGAGRGVAAADRRESTRHRPRPGARPS